MGKSGCSRNTATTRVNHTYDLSASGLYCSDHPKSRDKIHNISREISKRRSRPIQKLRPLRRGRHLLRVEAKCGNDATGKCLRFVPKTFHGMPGTYRCPGIRQKYVLLHWRLALPHRQLVKFYVYVYVQLYSCITHFSLLASLVNVQWLHDHSP